MKYVVDGKLLDTEKERVIITKVDSNDFPSSSKEVINFYRSGGEIFRERIYLDENGNETDRDCVRIVDFPGTDYGDRPKSIKEQVGNKYGYEVYVALFGEPKSWSDISF